MAVKFTSRQRLEMNMTAAFIELAITSATVWSQQHERVQHEGRGVDAPFVVRNRTGYTLLVWADSDKSLRSSGQNKSVQVRRLADNEAIPWRFQDHKRQREVSQPRSANIHASPDVSLSVRTFLRAATTRSVCNLKTCLGNGSAMSRSTAKAISHTS